MIRLLRLVDVIEVFRDYRGIRGNRCYKRGLKIITNTNTITITKFQLTYN